jgi:hypothetical protein
MSPDARAGRELPRSLMTAAAVDIAFDGNL